MPKCDLFPEKVDEMHFEFTCWISFALVVQFYLLLSPYLCFISFLYLDLYVLGDDALIS